MEKNAPNGHDDPPRRSFTYIALCGDGTLYTGWTYDVTRRLRLHNEGKGAKYTKRRRPVLLLYCEAFESKAEAMRREAQIKKLTRGQKLSLIAESKSKIVLKPV
jgi:putative endonuclease